ncbi:four-carbon acid sugar kinase family protein [Ramlibacter solisilvae]|uniref:Type III effector n=1 Tax=Ramlibacter tataouinensis TaxID=94132 RepID=A0A127JUJ1_9BURK|nr:four-carbon acid sugar kinase family protein [Ramlibacter tataouinensis]AMO23601.1 type III effector [Ramlibacter tataouinensis]
MDSQLLLAYYGDDFTGSTDAMDALTTAGVPTVLFLGAVDAELLRRFPGVRAVGVAGHARGRSPAWMREHLAPALAQLAALRAPVLQYKICSTFDSSPEIGSIGCAIDLGVPLLPNDWSPLVVGVPRLKRYQVFGHLFAAVDGEGWRIDRHPTMSRHPVTPMHESDLRLHLGQQTDRRQALIDFTRIKQGEADEALRLIREGGGTPVVHIDVLDEETLREAGRLVWEHRGEGLFSASSSGLDYALTAHWRASGVIGAPPELPRAAAAGPVLALCGSCSPVTARQIEWAQGQGFSTRRIDVAQVLAARPGERQAVVDFAVQALERGESPILFTALGPDDPAVRRFDEHAAAAGMSRSEAAVRTGEALGAIAGEIVGRCPGLRRIAVAGGDSSGEVAAALGVKALTMAAYLAPAAPLCRAWSGDARMDGLELVLKGGQLGGTDFFGRVRDGVPPG